MTEGIPMKEFGEFEISVVVPAYNEEKRLDSTLPHLWRSMKRRFNKFEIIVVDDGSTDGTGELVSRFSNEHQEVRLISYENNRGKGYAVRAGILASKGRYVLFSDADLSTPVREIRKLLKSMSDGYDIAIGSRANQEARIIKYQPFYRVLMGKTFNKLVQFLTVRGIKDTQCGFKCFRRNAAREIFSCCRIDGFSFDVEALFVARHKGFKIAEIGVLWRNNPQSKVNPVFDSMQMLRDLFIIRFFGVTGNYGTASEVRSRMTA